MSRVKRSMLMSIYICLWTKKIESYFSDQLTFSNIRGRTFRQIYRLALPLISPETLSSSSKSRIFLYNAHLALFVQMDDTITRTNSSVSIIWLGSKSSHYFADQTTSRIVANLERTEYEELRFRRGSPLECRVMGIACSSSYLSLNHNCGIISLMCIPHQHGVLHAIVFAVIPFFLNCLYPLKILHLFLFIYK